MTKSKEVTSAIMVVAAVVETVKEIGSIPSGHLYAQLMGRMNLETYEGIINTAKRCNLLKEENNVLTYCGPK